RHLFRCSLVRERISRKLMLFHNILYISKIYRDIFTKLGVNLVIYGWGMEEHDLHLLIRMAGIGIQRVAVSIFKKDETFSTKLIN
ncbi:DUF4917 family protein, partial [Cronobacter turicensis]